MLRVTKSINMTSNTPITRIERTSSGRFVIQKANSVDDECSSEAISSCSDNDDKLFASKCHRNMNDKCHNASLYVEDDDGDDENSDDSDADLILDNFDVTLVDDDSYDSPKNDAERMFLEVVEVLRYEQEVRLLISFFEIHLSTQKRGMWPFTHDLKI
jgi:hypothetical protein